MLWVIVDKLHLLFAAAALVAPFAFVTLGVVYGSRRTNPCGTSVAGRFALGGLGLGVLASLTLMFLAFCSPPPGEGILAHEGYRRGALVIAALDEFRRDHGQYPDSLALLAPAFLSSDVLEHPTGSRQAYSWHYLHRAPDAFDLAFRYVGPGMNKCETESASRRWTCSGYF